MGAAQRIRPFPNGGRGGPGAFAGLPGLSVESPVVLSEALEYAERGMDFADALHLGAAARCEALLTFDLRFIEQAGETPVKVMEP